MHSSDRATQASAVYGFCGAALLGVCTLVWALGALSGRDEERRRPHPPHRAAVRAEAERRCAGFEARAAFDCTYATLVDGEDARRAEAALTAQQRTACAAGYTAAAAALIALLLILAMWALRRTLAIARESVDATRRIGEAQVRCYLSVAKVIVDFTDHAAPVVSCRIVNAGQSPALGVRWQARLAYDAGQDGHLSWSGAAPTPGADSLTIAAKDSAIPRDITLTHDLSPGALRGLAGGHDMLVLCTVTLDATDVFGTAIHQRENFIGRLDTRLFTNPLVTMEPYGGELEG